MPSCGAQLHDRVSAGQLAVICMHFGQHRLVQPDLAGWLATAPVALALAPVAEPTVGCRAARMADA